MWEVEKRGSIICLEVWRERERKESEGEKSSGKESRGKWLSSTLFECF